MWWCGCVGHVMVWLCRTWRLKWTCTSVTHTLTTRWCWLTSCSICLCVLMSTLRHCSQSHLLMPRSSLRSGSVLVSPGDLSVSLYVCMWCNIQGTRNTCTTVTKKCIFLENTWIFLYKIIHGYSRGLSTLTIQFVWNFVNLQRKYR